MIWWNGVSSDDLGLYVEHYPERKLPERKTTFYSLPGRTGDYVYQQNAWNNYTQAYDIYISAEQRKLPNAMVAINAWLYSAQGYAKLEDSYDLDTYRMACFVGGQDIENMLNRYGRATIEFNCKPQRWLRSGEEWIDLTSAVGYSNRKKIFNPTGMPARPCFELECEGEIFISSSNNSLHLDDATDITDIDCETLEIWGDCDDPYTQAGRLPEFELDPKLGNIGVYLIGTGDYSITKVEMQPRWFAL